MPPLPVPTRCVVSLPPVSGQPKDTVKLDFSFASPTITLTNNIANFFNVADATWSASISNYLSPTISRAASGTLIQLYDLTGHLDGSATNRPPYYQTTFTLSSGATTALPSELAAVLSMHADFSNVPEHEIGERPRSRYRGRLFIGPMGTIASEADTSSKRALVAHTTMDILSVAAGKLLLAEPTWSVWSRRDAVMRPIIGGFVDNAWDVQRRRGELSSNKQFWP